MKKILYITIFFIIYINGYSQIPPLHNTANKIPLHKHAKFLRGYSNLNPDSILSDEIQKLFSKIDSLKSSSEYLDTTIKEDVIWLKIDFDCKNLDELIWTFNGWATNIDVYEITNKPIFYHSSKANRSLNESKVKVAETGNSVRLNLPKNGVKSYLLRCEYEREILNPHLLLSNGHYFRVENILVTYANDRFLVKSIFFSMFIMIIFYSLLMFLSSRELSYIYYSIYVFFVIATFSSTSFIYYLFPNINHTNQGIIFLLKISDITLTLSFVFYLIFGRAYLDLKNNSKKVNSILTYIINIYIPILLLISILYNFFNYDFLFNILVPINGFFILFSTIILIYPSYKIYKKGQKTALIFFIGNLIMAFSLPVFILVGTSEIDNKRLEEAIPLLPMLLEMIIFSFGISMKVKYLKIEKETAMATAMGKLEKKVNERTIELSEANEELNQQNEEISAQRDLIEEQKDQVEEAHQEIKSSINYAKRIQNAILPADDLIKKLIPHSFILYTPKDVVAGDFYWLEKSDNKTIFAAADCTGHGVPGAMVSVVCHNAMNRAVREFKLTEPGLILDKTREIVLEELSKSNEDVKDGMDIALCSIEGLTLKYSGANNPLWIIRGNEILETKADKQPIGMFDGATPFTSNVIELHQGDIIYLFSDGYQDQFGGENDKKFGKKRLKELLLSIQGKSMSEQKESMDTEIINWMKQSGVEQIDDICFMGVKIT